MKKSLSILLLMTSIITFSQTNEYSIGINSNVLYNKFLIGIETNLWKKTKINEFIPSFTIKINSGMLGYKVYELDGVIITENSVSVNSTQEPPAGKLLPKEGVNYKGSYYNSYEKVVLTGIDITLIKQFKIKDRFFFGTGLGWNFAKNNGYVIWYNPIIDDTFTKNTTFHFQTLYTVLSVGYSFNLSDKIILKTSLQSCFYIPVAEGKPSYQYSSSMPNVGSELDISISVNYKF